MFLTEGEPMPPLPLYDSDQSPPKYRRDLPEYEDLMSAPPLSMFSTTTTTMTSEEGEASGEETLGRTLHHRLLRQQHQQRQHQQQQQQTSQQNHTHAVDILTVLTTIESN